MGLQGLSIIFFMELIFNISTFRVNVDKPDHVINSVCSFVLQI